jgi:hypothetical protein
VFAKVVEGHSPSVTYVINGHEYTKEYYMADGIYPKWSTFLKTISNRVVVGKRFWSAQCQEVFRKDVE